MPREPIFGPRRTRSFLLAVELDDLLLQAQGDRHTTGNGLLTQIVQEWLLANGYLPEREEVAAEA